MATRADPVQPAGLEALSSSPLPSFLIGGFEAADHRHASERTSVATALP
ncbi:MAG TPA: hypothetical protein VKV24_02945 [Casimicrobiaceae bacterium]|nr:hypothetical protein [Casimicrobiaceae bacterium]